MSGGTTDDSHDRQWFIVERWQSYDGEARANVLRLLAVGLFYAVQMLQFFWFGDRGPAETAFHRVATTIVAAWLFAGLGVHVLLVRRVFPPALKFGTTAVDLGLLTLLAVFGGGPDSPLILAYFLIIALATLRFSLPLVRFATLGAMVCYLATVGAADRSWFDGDHVVPPVQQLVTLLSLGAAGVMLGQVIRRVRELADEFARRTSATQRGAA